MTHAEAWSIPLGVAAILGICGFTIQFLIRRGILK
jgi:hypothetical protein